MNRAQSNQIPNAAHTSMHSSSQNSASSKLASSNLNNLVATNDSIKLMAESIGITNLSDEACREVISDLTFTLKSIIIDAQKFSRKSRRKNLTSADIDYSLKARSLEPIYGFCSNDPVPFRCTTSTGGNGGGRSIYYLDDQVLDLNEIIAINNSSIKLPNDFVINAHWLAIEGVQPSVPENPQLVSRDEQKKEAIEGALSAKLKEKQPNQIQKINIGENLVKLKSLVPHDLSMEQQFYFKEITEACVGSDEQKRTEALNSLSIDPGLHQLLPRFILFISEGVRLNIIQTNMAILIYLMRMAKALIENKSIYLEKYLHELLPSVFSCLLSKQLCARPEIDNHYALREYCARLVGQVLKTYGPTLTFLQTRIIKVYLNSIESEKTTFSTLFGAIVGLAELGDDICESVTFPLVKMLGERVEQILDSNATNQEKLPAEKVKQEIIKITTKMLKTKPQLANDELDYLTSKFGSYFGQLINSQLIKFRGQQPANIQAQFATSAPQQPNTQTRTSNASQIITNNNRQLNSQPALEQSSQLSASNPKPTQTSSNTEKTDSNVQNSDFEKINSETTKSAELTDSRLDSLKSNENQTIVNQQNSVNKYENSLHTNPGKQAVLENTEVSQRIDDDEEFEMSVTNAKGAENAHVVKAPHSSSVFINEDLIDTNNQNYNASTNPVNESNMSKSSTDQSEDWFF